MPQPHSDHHIHHQRRSVHAAQHDMRTLTSDQLGAVRAIMRRFVDDDLANDVTAAVRMFCDACQESRPAPGFIRYDRHLLCNICATEFEVARLRGVLLSAGQFVRDKRFGDGDAFALAPASA